VWKLALSFSLMPVSVFGLRLTGSVRLLGVIFGIPQALPGLTCFGSGCAILIWVLYNLLVERQPEFTVGLLGFGVAPGLILPTMRCCYG
jgi:hypothetical protein